MGLNSISRNLIRHNGVVISGCFANSNFCLGFHTFTVVIMLKRWQNFVTLACIEKTLLQKTEETISVC